MPLMSLSRVAMIGAVVLLAGCAAQNGSQALGWNNLDLAEAQAKQAVQRGDPSGYNNLGVVAERRGYQNLANEYYTVAARMGEPTARLNLTRRQQPVPTADLAIQQAAAPAAPAVDPWASVAAGMTGYAQGRYSAPPMQPLSHHRQNSSLKPFPAIPPLGAKKCTPKAVVEAGRTTWVQVCE